MPHVTDESDTGDMAKYAELCDYRRRAFEFISQAIQCEETGENENLAQSLYRVGIRELEQGLEKLDEEIGVGITSERTDDKILKIRKEMLTGLGKAQDRLEFLQGKAVSGDDDDMVIMTETDSKQSNSPIPTQGKKGARPKPLNPTIASNSSTNKNIPYHSTNDMSDSMNQESWSQRYARFSRPTVSYSLKTKSMQNINQESVEFHVRNFRNAHDPESPTKPMSPASCGSRHNDSRKHSQDDGCVRNKKQEYASELESFLASTIVDEEDQAKRISFSDIVGQNKAKDALQEIVILPTQRPELFSGLRTPAKGLLLFGPPGNGKTLLAKALASEAGSVLFSITASCLTSKFLGEGEKLVKTLFEMARERAPSIIFIDEVDSILCSRKENDHEASRRMKTEFFASFDGLASSSEDKILVVGATNRPQELDDAALRRFTKRIYVRMPDLQARKLILVKLLSEHDNPLSANDIERIATSTAGYSGSDLTNLAREAAFGPIREIGGQTGYDIRNVPLDQIRQISKGDFENALSKVRTSVDKDILNRYEKWNVQYGDVS